MFFRRLVLLSSVFAVFLFGAVRHAMAVPAPDRAKVMVESMANDAISILSSPERSPEQIRATFHQLLSENFDIEGIARFVLGRYWRLANEEERAEYVDLFEDYIVSIYADRFNNYSGETVTVENAQLRGNSVVVTSYIHHADSSAPPVLVEWKISDRRGGEPRVEDVVIEQVSMSITQRSEFKTIIQNNGGRVESLLERLRSRVK